MTKPHEYDLHEEINPPMSRDVWLYPDRRDDPVAVVMGEADPKWVPLLKAAPKMARALLLVKQQLEEADAQGLPGHNEVCAALREAGVLE